jgi:Ca2+-binding RTX toxin-like protein
VVAIASGIVLRARGNKGRSTIRFTLTRSGNTSGLSSVDWVVRGRGDNPAKARDFRGKELPSGTEDFAAGESSRRVSIRVRPDDGQKGFALRLTQATGAQLGRSQARATIAPRDNLIGTGRDDRIKGSQRSEFIQGGGGQDLLTGGGGEDLFGFRFGDSPIGTPDRITDFTFGEDRITLLNRKGKPGDLPTRFSRAADNSTARTLEELAAAVFADADGGRKGNQPLRRRSAALVRATNDEIAGTYLLINNNKAGLKPGKDLMVNITGFNGDLPELGRIDSGLVFA